MWCSPGIRSWPLFFAIYINDINNAVGQNYVRLFADDTALFMHHPDVNTLTLDIISKFNELNRWCISNKLTINASKQTSNFSILSTNLYLIISWK